jgi:hypothetical protein
MGERVLRIVVNATVPSRKAERAAERVADAVCDERGLINRGHATFVGRSIATVDGRRCPVVVYAVKAHHRDDADGRSNDVWRARPEPRWWSS